MAIRTLLGLHSVQITEQFNYFTFNLSLVKKKNQSDRLHRKNLNTRRQRIAALHVKSLSFNYVEDLINSLIS